jgi:hypothetical protein
MGKSSLVIERERAKRLQKSISVRESLISELGLSKGIDPKIAAAVFDRVGDPVTRYASGGKMYRSYTKQQTADLFAKKYKSELAKVGQPELAKAIAAGSDPRSVESLKENLLSAYTTPAVSRVGGKAQHISGKVKAREKAVAEQTQKAKNILIGDADEQPDIQQLRQKRKSLIEMEAKALTRKTGRRALLTSAPGGGSGFYGGYFDGK